MNYEQRKKARRGSLARRLLEAWAVMLELRKAPRSFGWLQERRELKMGTETIKRALAYLAARRLITEVRPMTTRGKRRKHAMWTATERGKGGDAQIHLIAEVDGNGSTMLAMEDLTERERVLTEWIVAGKLADRLSLAARAIDEMAPHVLAKILVGGARDLIEDLDAEIAARKLS